MGKKYASSAYLVEDMKPLFERLLRRGDGSLGTIGGGSMGGFLIGDDDGDGDSDG